MSALGRLAARPETAHARLIGDLGRAGLVDVPIEATSGARVRSAGQWLLNFASANYLGLADDPRLKRALASLPAGLGVSLGGAPRRLATDPVTPSLERTLARRVGQERALVFPSTVHAARDVIHLLAGQGAGILADEWAYSVGVDAARQAVTDGGGHLWRFRHNDPSDGPTETAQVIICDGVYAETGQPAPLPGLLQAAEARDAVLYVDDAHGFGVFGARPRCTCPYGRGGGGTPAFWALPAGRLVYVASLSKPFGVPLAFVAGPADFIEHLYATAKSSSQPAVPVLATAAAALAITARTGDRRRRQLAEAVGRFRAGLRRLGVGLATDSLFPVQSVHFPSPAVAVDAAVGLRRAGLWTLPSLSPREHPGGGAIRFVLSAQHDKAIVEEALELLRDSDLRSMAYPPKRRASGMSA